MSRFRIVVGTSMRSAELAAKDAERKARRVGGEQISIAADVLGGGGTPASNKLLDNMARNIYQLVQCTCLTTVGKEKHTPGVPPPPPSLGLTGPAGGTLWVVYILIRL